MKKIFSLITLLLMMLTLSSCVREVIVEVPVYPEVDEDKDNDNDQDKDDDKDSDKDEDKDDEDDKEEVDKPEINYDRVYAPGTYFKAGEANEDGVTTFVTVVIDEYGMISGVHIDNTSIVNEYLYDSETETVYMYVKGLDDVIPSSYRVVDVNSGSLPSIDDAITTKDLIVGFPEHQSKIESLEQLDTNETRQIADSLSADPSETWSHQINLVAKKIVSDQTTLGITTYKSGSHDKIRNIDGVDILISDELDLVQEILNVDANLDSKDDLKDLDDAEYGFYQKGQSFYPIDTPIINENGIDYQYAFVAVDNFGKIAGVLIDETFNSKGHTTTRYLAEDDDFIDSAEALATAVVKNQGLAGFEFSDSDGEEVSLNDVTSSKVLDGEYVNPVTFDNLDFDFVANPYIQVLDKAMDGTTMELEQGNYFLSDEFGNMMSVIVDSSGIITALTLDSLDLGDQAYATIEGDVVELYTYTKAVEDIHLDVEEHQLVIYEKNGDYFHIDTNNSLDYEAGDRVSFDDEIIDEEATISAMPSLATKATNSKYDDSDDGLTFAEQSRLYTDFFIGSAEPFGLNMLEDGTTDSIEGLTMEVEAYNSLLAELLLLATDSNNEAPNIIQVVDGINDKFDDYLLGDGSYYAVSNQVTPDGGFYYLTVTVKDNKLHTIMVDETIINKGDLTTKVLLGDDYKVEYDSSDNVFVELEEDDIDKDSFNFAEAAADSILEDFTDAGDILDLTGANNLLDDYDYNMSTDLEKDADFINTDEMDPYNDAFETIILESLQVRVTETIKDLEDYINNELDKDEAYVVAADEEVDGALNINLFDGTNPNQVNLLYIGGEEFLDVDVDSSDRDLDADLADVTIVSSGSSVDKDHVSNYQDAQTITLSAEVEDVPTSKFIDVDVNFEFDEVSSTVEMRIPTYSNDAYKQKMLDVYTIDPVTGEVNYVNDELTINGVPGKYEGMASGSVVDLALAGIENATPATLSLSPDRLGNDADVNKDLLFEVDNIDEEAQAFADKIILKSISDDEKELVLTLVSINFDENGESTIIYTVTGEVGSYEYLGYEIEITSAIDIDSDGSTNDNEITLVSTDANKEVLKDLDFAGVTIDGSINLTGSDTKDDNNDLNNKGIAEVFGHILELTNGDVVPSQYYDKTASSGEETKNTKITVVAQVDEVASITLKAFYDAYEQEDAEDGKGTYQRGEAYREFTLDVYGDEELVRYAKRNTYVGTVLDEVTSANYPVDLSDITDYEVAGLVAAWSGTADSRNKYNNLDIEYAKVYENVTEGEDDVIVWFVDDGTQNGQHVTLRLDSSGDPVGFDMVQITNGKADVSTNFDVDDNDVFGGVTIDESSNANADAKALELASDAFKVVDLGDGDLVLYIDQLENESIDVELTTTFSKDVDGKETKNFADSGDSVNDRTGDFVVGVSDKDIDNEFRITEKTERQIIESFEQAIDAAIEDIGLTSYINKADLGDYNDNTGTDADTAEGLALAIDGDIENGTDNNVEVKWYIDNNIIAEETTVAKALRNRGADDLNNGESEKFNIKFVVDYEYNDEEYTYTSNKTIVVYSNSDN